MTLKAYSIRDQKGEIFNPPFFQKTHGEAERSFRILVNDEKSTLSQYPEDYDLYFIGEYDDQSGIFDPVDTPQHVQKAIMLKETKTPL